MYFYINLYPSPCGVPRHVTCINTGLFTLNHVKRELQDQHSLGSPIICKNARLCMFIAISWSCNLRLKVFSRTLSAEFVDIGEKTCTLLGLSLYRQLVHGREVYNCSTI